MSSWKLPQCAGHHQNGNQQGGADQPGMALAKGFIQRRAEERGVHVRAADYAGDEQVDEHGRGADQFVEDQRNHHQHAAAGQVGEVPAFAMQPEPLVPGSRAGRAAHRRTRDSHAGMIPLPLGVSEKRNKLRHRSLANSRPKLKAPAGRWAAAGQADRAYGTAGLRPTNSPLESAGDPIPHGGAQDDGVSATRARTGLARQFVDTRFRKLESVSQADAQLQSVIHVRVENHTATAITHAQALTQGRLNTAFQRQAGRRPPGDPATDRVTADFNRAPETVPESSSRNCLRSKIDTTPATDSRCRASSR